MSQKRAGKNQTESKSHTVTVCPEICVKRFFFKVDIQSVFLQTKCSWVNLSQGKHVTVDISSGSSKCHGGRNLGGRNVKAPRMNCVLSRNMLNEIMHHSPICIMKMCIFSQNMQNEKILQRDFHCPFLLNTQNKTEHLCLIHRMKLGIVIQYAKQNCACSCNREFKTKILNILWIIIRKAQSLQTKKFHASVSLTLIRMAKGKNVLVQFKQ